VVPMSEPQTPVTCKNAKRSTALHKTALEPNPVAMRKLLESMEAKSFSRFLNAQEVRVLLDMIRP